MTKYTWALINTKHGANLIEIYGHTSNSLPGLEITGLGKHGKIIKEKILYLTKLSKKKIPLKKFSICIGQEGINSQQITSEELYHLEIPILILFWSLANFIPLNRIDNCCSFGKIGASGMISVATPPTYVLNNIKVQYLNQTGHELLYVLPEVIGGIASLPLKEILNEFPYLKFHKQLNINSNFSNTSPHGTININNFSIA